MSGRHISDELPRLLTGEAPRDVVLEAAGHLRSCVDCQHELVSAVVAHASLTSAQRFAPEVVVPALPSESEPDPDPDPAPLPDLSTVFERVREESRQPPARRRPRTRYLVAAAAAAVVIGGGTAAIVTATNGSDTGSGQTVQLAAFGTGRAPEATAHIVGSKMTIDAADLPPLPDHRYEVWLTDNARQHMQPIGWIGTDGRATLTVPGDLMGRYSDIEVSVQNVDAGDYNYSGTSVLRGSYG